ncbi:MAG: hypothetical protein HQK54_06845, partial [Oligoflexales bacterium]|nr:hypothetical protein [Oligoflexales bacterium]
YVQNWEVYEKIRLKLLESGFEKTQIKSRVRFKLVTIDLIPFGGVESSKNEIIWPEDGRVMNMIGFDEVYKTAHRVFTPSRHEIRIASLAGLVLLKIVAWSDRPLERSQDPQDIAIIIKNYFDAGNEDRFYEENSDLVELDPFTVERAGAALIGRDLKKICNNKSLSAIISILKKELKKADKSLFLQQMSYQHKFEWCEDVLNIFLKEL